MTRMHPLFLGLALAALGCGGPTLVPDAVPVKGQVKKADGTPVKDLLISFRPLERGAQEAFELGDDGTFTGKAIPGKYSYYFVALEGKKASPKSEKALQTVPEKYREANLDRNFVVSGTGADLQFTLN